MILNNLLTQLDKGLLTITINRANKLNALNKETISELDTVLGEVYDNTNIKGVIITGAGTKAFAAGADISEFLSLNDLDARKLSERGQKVFEKIAYCHKVIIAAVNGFALGGGCELAMACHIRVASESAHFGQPEVKLGIIPGYGGTQRLTELVGKGKAFELILSGEMINAREAEKIALVNHVVPAERVMEKCRKIAEKIFTQAPIAVSHAIDCIHAATSGKNYGMEANAFANCCKTKDFKEGTSAFLAKRKANFTGI